VLSSGVVFLAMPRWRRVSFSLLLSRRRSGKFSNTMGIYRMYPGRSRCDRLPQRARICTLNNAKYDTLISRFLSNPVRRPKISLTRLRPLCYKQLSVHKIYRSQ
jgi:hypothetical protein